MQCEQAQRALNDARYAQGEGEGEGGGAESGEREALRAHLAQCPACSALQARHAQLDRALALAEPAVASPDFDARFFARLERERARSRRRKRFAIAAAVLPIAAAVAIALLRNRPSAPEPMMLMQLPASDVELALELDLVEDLDVVEHMDEIEAYELLGQLDDAELERILAETK